MIFAVLDPSPLTVCINCSFLHLYSILAPSKDFSAVSAQFCWRQRSYIATSLDRQFHDSSVWFRLPQRWQSEQHQYDTKLLKQPGQSGLRQNKSQRTRSSAIAEGPHDAHWPHATSTAKVQNKRHQGAYLQYRGPGSESYGRRAFTKFSRWPRGLELSPGLNIWDPTINATLVVYFERICLLDTSASALGVLDDNCAI